MSNTESQTNRPPAVSIVIPTHNRAQRLGHVLRSIARQDYDLDSVEVIVVDDGSQDDTQTYLASQDWGLRLRVMHQPQSGVATARNHGAVEASAPILIFIDDDVAPAPGFIQAHMQAQAAAGGCVAIGRLAPSDSQDDRPPPWWRWQEWQFEKQYGEMTRGERALDGLALYSGNFGLPRELFWRVGGFDPAVKVREDTALGLRLQDAGAVFRLCLDAVGHHSGYRGFDAWRGRAYEEGVWDSERLLKMGKVDALTGLVRQFHARHPLLRFSAGLLLDRRRSFNLVLWLMRRVADVAGLLRLHRVQRYAYGGIYDLTYWRGFCDGLGGFTLFRRYLQSEDLQEAPA